MTDNLTVTIASDQDHEKVFAEIYSHGKFVGIVSQEEGADRLRIEFPSFELDETMIARSVDLEDFRQGLTAAIERLTAKM